MKALSLRQPWATLVVNGDKTIEIRSWRPRNMALPERIWIHAGQKPDMEMLAESGILEDLPRGAIIGQATLTGIVRYMHPRQWLKDLSGHLNRPDRYRKGMYGFVLSEPIPCSPIPIKGRLGFFHVPQHLLFSPLSSTNAGRTRNPRAARVVGTGSGVRGQCSGFNEQRATSNEQRTPFLAF